MKNILVTIDGSETARKSLLEAKKIGSLNDSKITILNVVSNIVAHPSMIGRDYSIKTNEGLVKLSREMLEDSLKLFENFEGEVEIKQRIGDAGKEIIDECENGDYDLLVMGNRGLGAFSRVMLGSVSNKVVNNVDINVLIIKDN